MLTYMVTLMNSTIVVAFLFLVIPAFITPGPNNLMLMASGARFGVRRTLAHVIGINLGFPLMLVIVGLGLGEIFYTYPIVKTVMKYAAAGYFLWLAWHLLGMKLGAEVGASRPMKLHEAMLFQWINPKAWAISVSFIAAFVGAGDDRLSNLFWLTLGCFVVSPPISMLWLVSGQQLYLFLKRTGGEKYLGAILAILMLMAVILFLI